MRPQLVAVLREGSAKVEVFLSLPFLFPRLPARVWAAIEGDTFHQGERMKTSGVNLKFARGSGDWIIARLILWNDCSKEVGACIFPSIPVRGEGRDPERSKVGEQVWERRFFFLP